MSGIKRPLRAGSGLVWSGTFIGMILGGTKGRKENTAFTSLLFLEVSLGFLEVELRWQYF